MALKRVNTKYDVRHGGIFTDELDNESIPIVDGTDPNHSQKLRTDADFRYKDSTLEVPNAIVQSDLTVDGVVTLDGSNTDSDTVLEVQKQAHFSDEVHADSDVFIQGSEYVEGTSNIKQGITVESGGANITGTTTINGDLHVTGTAYEEHSTDLYVGADFVTLRDGAETGLQEGERAGVIINNYNGEGDSLGLVMTNDGTLKLGEFDTVKVYTKDDVTYYSDRDLTTETTIPSGAQLFQIGDTDEETGLTEYYYVSKDDTEAIATRADDSELNDQALMKWNAESRQMDTIDVPSDSDQYLVSDKDEEGNVSYHWEDIQKGVYVFDTKDDYDNFFTMGGTIRDGSLVVIKEDTEYLLGEDR